MELSLFDTFTKVKRPFVPLTPANIRMYVCGPTVYDFAHIGNARPIIVFDVLFRLLTRLAEDGVWDGGRGETEVVYVRNITDVDDKINDRARRDFPNDPLNEAIRKLTRRTEKQFFRDVKELGCRPPTFEPRATQHIPEMRELIQKLIDGGYAYVEQDHVLFEVSKMKDYGRLSHRSLDEMLVGARIEVAPYKRDPMDFVLWKPSSPEEPSWLSPGGISVRGRPGWHVECSAMAWKYLGEQFDIHGGGVDLVFPHHENEHAQTCCAFHEDRMANFWMHNGFLQVDGEKMSKSAGNFFTIRDLLRTSKFGGRKWAGEDIRFAMLQTHYRQPIDWTPNLLEQSSKRLESWRRFAAERVESRSNTAFFEEFLAMLCDDLNTPGAMAIVDRVINSKLSDDRDRYTVNKILYTLGFTRPRSELSQLAQNMNSVVRAFSHIPRQNLEQYASSVIRKPTTSAGKPRPVTSVVASALAFAEFFNQIKADFEAASPVTKQITTKFLDEMTNREIEELIAARLLARSEKDFEKSDAIRRKLAEMSVVLKDGKDPQGNPITTWEKAR
jgi:cysteinyl-tRNA synthetase